MDRNESSLDIETVQAPIVLLHKIYAVPFDAELACRIRSRWPSGRPPISLTVSHACLEKSLFMIEICAVLFE